MLLGELLIPAAAGSTRPLALALLLAVLAAVLASRRAYRRGRRGLLAALLGGALLAVLVLSLSLGGGGSGSSHGGAGRGALATNASLDPGQRLNRPAPDFTLTDQRGARVKLSQFRGRVVLLAFNDDQCTTICPLTTTAMLDAQAMLGRAGREVQLLGVNANPRATSVKDVAAYTQVHGLTGRWQFLTGGVAALKRVWHAYGIASNIFAGLIDHTPALYVIDPQGRIRELFLTQMSYASIAQLGQLLARDVSALLPGHPAVHSNLSYAPVSGIAPTQRVSVPRFGGGRIALGPGRPRLLLFFDSWDREVLNMNRGFSGIDAYQRQAARLGLPPVTAIDEGAVEPAGALAPFIASLRPAPAFPVGIDTSGRLADGYEVSDQPWLVLLPGSGRIAWHLDVSTSGWPAHLAATVRAALTRVPVTHVGELAGSPTVLAALHRQASRLEAGGYAGLLRRLRALRGHPVVVNVWASWCDPCRAEFGLFAYASATYGKRVAFLGADVNDSNGDARAFLAQHHVYYPSYAMSATALAPLAQLQGTPETIFISPSGHVLHVHVGQYDSQGTLDEDIAVYAFGVKPVG